MLTVREMSFCQYHPAVAMTPPGSMIAQRVAELVQHRQSAARNPGFRTTEVAWNYVSQVGQDIQAGMEAITDLSEWVQAQYGLGLVALSHGDVRAAAQAGRELAKWGDAGRAYLDSLISQPDVRPEVLVKWGAALDQHDAGVGR